MECAALCLMCAAVPALPERLVAAEHEQQRDTSFKDLL